MCHGDIDSEDAGETERGEGLARYLVRGLEESVVGKGEKGEMRRFI